MQTSHTERQIEQKQTHGSGRILKPGPYSIKASLGPSSMEAPPLLYCRHSSPVDILSLSPPPSVSWSTVEQLPPSSSCLPLCHSAAPPCLAPPSIPLHPLLLVSSCIVMTAAVVVYATAKGEKHECVCPCVCLSLSSSPIHS